MLFYTRRAADFSDLPISAPISAAAAEDKVKDCLERQLEKQKYVVKWPFWTVVRLDRTRSKGCWYGQTAGEQDVKCDQIGKDVLCHTFHILFVEKCFIRFLGHQQRGQKTLKNMTTILDGGEMVRGVMAEQILAS